MTIICILADRIASHKPRVLSCPNAVLCFHSALRFTMTLLSAARRKSSSHSVVQITELYNANYIVRSLMVCTPHPILFV